MADIFSEIDEDLRKDKSRELWNKYGVYFIALIVLIVVGTAAYAGWRNYQQSRAQEQGAAFSAAAMLAANGDHAAAAKAFATLAEEGSDSYRALASLREAAALRAAGDGAAALAVYDRLAADSSVEPEFSSLARLMAGYYLLENGSTADVRARIEPLLESGRLWSASANELLALTQIKDGDIAGAKATLALVQNDADAPEVIQGRVRQLLDALEGK